MTEVTDAPERPMRQISDAMAGMKRTYPAMESDGSCDPTTM